jgi:hypothetical protein
MIVGAAAPGPVNEYSTAPDQGALSSVASTSIVPVVGSPSPSPSQPGTKTVSERTTTSKTNQIERIFLLIFTSFREFSKSHLVPSIFKYLFTSFWDSWVGNINVLLSL